MLESPLEDEPELRRELEPELEPGMERSSACMLGLKLELASDAEQD